ncbi:hypothetical protein RFI_11089 [Reticulomyxa filosa]|uniref:Uncharacterized protein n=1 Tax=Reticulomyxa filosa TaxID=46433 RepID=X6NJ68_RETFI|nr:hypothetical protein RFI_11089 [Reticulomyxa filosa]|eukprot:ETO26046.1 hypothetical protein RFI_11089 [Reticulomyxa filosa]
MQGWDEKPLHECVAELLVDALSNAKTNVENNASGEQMRAKLIELSTIAQPIQRLIRWLNFGASQMTQSGKRLEEYWDKLKLWILCVTTIGCEVDYNWPDMFDNNFQLYKTEAVDKLFRSVQATFRQRSSMSIESDDALQYWIQRYVQEFCHKQRMLPTDEMEKKMATDFSEHFVSLLSGQHNHFIEPNLFTRTEIALQLMNMICRSTPSPNVMSHEEKTFDECTIKRLSHGVNGRELTSDLAVLLIRAHEQFLHFEHTSILSKSLKRDEALDASSFLEASNALITSIQTETKLEQLIKIARCKFLTFRLSLLLSKTMEYNYRYISNGIQVTHMQSNPPQTALFLTAEQCKDIGSNPAWITILFDGGIV